MAKQQKKPWQKRDEDISALYTGVSVEPRRSKRKPKKKEHLSLFRRPIVFPPDGAEVSKTESYLGILFRALVLLLTVFAFTFFITDTFRFGYMVEVQDKWGNIGLEDYTAITDTVFTASLVVTVIFLLMAFFRIARYLLPLAGVATVGILTVLDADTPKRLFAILQTAGDEILARLHRVDYFTLISRPTIDPAGLTEKELALASVYVVATVIALIFIPALVKRVRIAVPMIYCIVSFSFIFACNITRSNWPFTLVLCSLMAILVMWRYDVLYRRSPSAELFDTTADFFPDSRRPVLSEDAKAYFLAHEGRKAAKKLRRQEKKEEKKRKKALRRGQASVDTELTDYFAPPTSKKKEPRVRLTPKEKRMQKKAKRDAKRDARKKISSIKAEVESLKRYDEGVVARRSASAGFAGLAAFLLAFIVLLFPTLTVDQRFKAFEAIDAVMQDYREYLTALLVGDEDILDALDYERNPENHQPHGVALQNRYYSGQSQFYIRARSYETCYLRGWIAVDYVNGAWVAADAETLEDYQSAFDLDEFPAEELREEFYAYFLTDTYLNDNYDSLNFLERARYENEFGTVMEQVSIRRLNERLGSLLYLPTTLIERMGLKDFESTEKSDLNFVNYFDGIYTGRDFKTLAEYSAMVYVGSMKNSYYPKLISERIDSFSDNYELFTLYQNGYFTDPDVNPEVLVEEIEGSTDVRMTATYEPFGVTIRSRCTKRGAVVSAEIAWGDLDRFALFHSYIRRMTKSEQYNLEQYFKKYAEYREFVYRTYLSESLFSENPAEETTGDGTLISSLADRLYGEMLIAERDTAGDLMESEGYLRHAYIKYILKYFYDNMTYLSYDEETYDIIVDPSALESSALLDPVEDFLIGSKQGYCVQFASALTLLLRAQGIPARYVEGYVASDFLRDDSVRGAFIYQQTIRDYNAHAWVEVWFDGIGWVTYEATTGDYYRDFYPTEDLPPIEDDGDEPSRPTPPEKDPEEEEETETPPEVDLEQMTPEEREEYEKQLRRAELLRKLKIFLTWFAILLAVAGAVTTVVLLAERAEKRRDAHINRIKLGQFTDEERRREALWLIDEITALLGLYGLAPKVGEQRDEYAERLLTEMPSVFGKAPQVEGDDKLSPSAFTYPMEADEIYRYMAAEEFGNGMTKREMREVAEYFSRLRTQKVRFIALPRRFILHFVLHRI